ncbi:PorV/PorQ family protein [Rhodothermus profundi]|uniref:PorV/PorQ family protein n=1 Tax=Rhodothermus profundi TaxID=633813 RepID=UPI001FE2529E|nr:PorV/PorQ family protein [Rhodothermus profundi]
MAAWAQLSNEGPARATITKVGTTSAQFLKLGVGARPLALGGAYVAMGTDLPALYWNVAGLAWFRGGAAQFTHTNYLAGISYDVALVAISLGAAGSIGAGLYYLNSGEMLVRTVEEPEGTGERFSVQSLALQLSYARRLTDRFSLGGSIKYIRETIWHSSASAVAVDIGVRFITPFERLVIGASIANFGPKMRMDGRDIYFSVDPDPQNQGNVEVVNAAYLLDAYDLPLLFRFGVAFTAFENQDVRLLLMTDAAHPNDNTEYVNVGAEINLRDLLAFRIGYKNAFERDGEQGLTLGGGLTLVSAGLRAHFDFAHASFGRLGSTQWISVGIAF